MMNPLRRCRAFTRFLGDVGASQPKITFHELFVIRADTVWIGFGSGKTGRKSEPPSEIEKARCSYHALDSVKISDRAICTI